MWTFLKSAPSKKHWLQGHDQEYCFIGRSNVGKSSLINALAQRKKLAYVSKKPGRTKLINYFLSAKNKIIVDLPGYGYAHTSKTNQQKIITLINQYINKCKHIAIAFLLIDSKIGPTKLDYEMINKLNENEINFIIIFTKNDKSNQKNRFKNQKIARENGWQFVEVSTYKKLNIQWINDKIDYQTKSESLS